MHASRIRRQASQLLHAPWRVVQRGSPRSRPARVLAAAVLAAALAGSVLAMSRPDPQLPRLTAARAHVRPAAVVSQPGLLPVTLATGQQVRLTPAPGGRSVVQVTRPGSGAARPPARTGGTSTGGPSTGGPPAGTAPGRPDGTGVAALGQAASPVESFQVGGDTYAVPAYALPYLGTRLDPRLFDLSYLQRAGYASLRALPVSITWQHQQHSAIPGITTAGSGLRTTGSIPAGSAAQFGQAVQDSLRAALPAHQAAGASAASPAAAGAFAQVRKISLAPLQQPQASRAASALPAMPDSMPTTPATPLTASSAPKGTRLYSLTLHPLGRTGKPGYALITIQNLDHLGRYYSVTSVTPDAPLQVSLPAGRYGIEASIYAYGFSTFPDSIALVSRPDVTVSRDTSLTLDARQAKPVTVSVPRAAVTQQAALSYARISADGAGLSAIFFGYGPGVSSLLPRLQVYATPTPAPAVGALDFADSWELVPAGTGLEGVDAPYVYSLDFAGTRGVPATLARKVTASDLATVHENFDASLSGAGALISATPFHPWSLLAFGLSSTALGPFPVPASQTDYVGGSPASTTWDLAYEPWTGSGAAAPNIYAPYQKFRPGEKTSVTWGAAPSVPTPEWQGTGIAVASESESGILKPTWSYICPVCRQGDVMSFNAVPSGDDNPRHSESWVGIGLGSLSGGEAYGYADSELKFYRNGVLTQIAGAPGQVFPMLPGEATYKIDWTTSVPPTWTALGTSEDTTWTFRSGHPAKADKLPAYELCSPDVNNACSYLPLLFASYDFGATASGQVTAPGTETFTVTGYHEKGAAAPVPDHASVQVSFDDGKTWAPASSVTAAGGGTFKVSVQDPDPATTTGYASLRIRLSDAAGDALDQTIIRAYALTGAAAAHGISK